MSPPKIALIHEAESSFIAQDARILASAGYLFDSGPVGSLRAISVKKIATIAKIVLHCDITVTWFTSGWAPLFSFLLAKLLRKRFMTIAGGSDVSSNPSVRTQQKLLRFEPLFLPTWIILENADLVVCVSEFTRQEILCYSSPKKAIVIPHGIDTEVFYPDGSRNAVLTVAAGQPSRKGIDRFLRLAQLMPQRSFVIIGTVGKSGLVRNNSPDNLVAKGKVSLSELIADYQNAKFYCQLSRHEAFGVSVAEAMACGCVPVVSDSGALPELVGDTGIVVPNGDPKLAMAAIESSWTTSESLGRRARERIVSTYSAGIRSRELSRAVLSLQDSQEVPVGYGDLESSTSL